MQYDGDGNRLSRIENGTEVRYLVDEMNPTGWPQVAEEVVGGNVVAQYTHGLMRISQNRDSGSGFVTSYYGYDAGGSVRQLFDAAGAETDEYAYDAFGNTLEHTGTTVNPYQYRGEQFDPSLGMYYLRARYYMPSTGRFLTMDTWRYLNCDPQVLWEQLYAFANADPVSNSDPSGYSVLVDAATSRLWRDLGRATVLTTITAGAVCVMELADSVLASAVYGAIYGFDFEVERVPGMSCFFRIRRNASCEEEWERARRRCADLLANPRRRTPGIWGGSYDSCVRGQVSERCGGNRVN